MMKGGKLLYLVSLILVLVGALNWALVAYDPSSNVVEMAVGKDYSNYVYYAVGAAALIVAWCNFRHFKSMM